jgi:hypothetical protein
LIKSKPEFIRKGLVSINNFFLIGEDKVRTDDTLLNKIKKLLLKGAFNFD